MNYNNFIQTGLLAISLLSVSLNAKATDFIVDEAGTYTTIQSAIDAASDGDRIFIKNRSNATPYLQNLTLNKAVSLYSNQNDVQFDMTGNITIAPVNGGTIIIQGMHNTSSAIALGTITQNTKIQFIDSKFDATSINVDHAKVIADFLGNTINTNTSVRLSFGDFIGNELLSTATSTGLLAYSNLYAADPNTQTARIVGNRIIYNSSTNSTYGIYYLGKGLPYIANNYIKYNASSNSGLYVSLTNVTLTNKPVIIENNTIHNNNNNTGGGYVISFLALSTAQAFIIQNNILNGYNGNVYSINMTAATYTNTASSINSNVSNSTIAIFDPSVIVASNFGNTINAPITIDNSATGAVSSTNAIDKGNPNSPYDIDLTRNDRGCFGGPFSHNNFFPLHTGAAKVYYMQLSSYTLHQGDNLTINGEGLDR